MILGEARGGVATVGDAAEVFAGVVILAAEEVTLDVVGLLVAGRSQLGREGVDFLNLGGESAGGCGGEIFGSGLVVFVTDHGVNIVLAKRVGVGKGLHIVGTHRLGVDFLDAAVYVGRGTEVGVVILALDGVAPDDVARDVGLEPGGEHEVGCESAVELVV